MLTWPTAGWSQIAAPAAGLKGAQAKSSHFPFGEVEPPRKTLPWPVDTHLGQRTDLARLLLGKTTAVQFMFTGCTASCPIQGALFAQAQALAAAQADKASQEAAKPSPQLQWLSLSIDALADSPARLQAWLQAFSAQPGWLAAVPAVADVDAIQAAWGEGGQGPLSQRDPHSGQVFLFNKAAQLVYRTASIPPARDIFSVMQEVARRWP